MQEDFDSFDIPPTATASSYLHRLTDDAVKGKFERLLAKDTMERAVILNTTMNDRFTDLLTIFLMRALIPKHVVGKYNDSSFYITHPDLHNRNIIIEGRPISDSFTNVTQMKKVSITSTLDHSNSFHSPSEVVTLANVKPDGLKIVCIVDWDAAHPLPLQAAAIYPKFLETLPGAEFPDIPKNYQAPNLEREKTLFLRLLGQKEHEQTGHTIVTDLIKNGS